MEETSAKYQHVRAKLEEAIRNGEFAVGEQLPAEQSLADRYGVSYLTARRAVCALVEADLVERRARKGTFVRSHSAPTTTLSLITSSYDHSLMREFIATGVNLAEKQGWQPHIIRLSAGQQDAAVRAIRGGDLALVLLDEISRHSALAHAMRAAKGRALCLGSPTAEAGVPCILNNPEEFFQMAVDYLVEQGHRDLIFVNQVGADAGDQIQNNAWHHATAALFSTEEADRRHLPVTTARFRCPTPDAYEAVSAFLKQSASSANSPANESANESAPGVSAFLSFGDEITQGVLAAIRDANRSTGDDLSVLNVLDSPAMRFAHPPVTSLDVNLKEQFRVALELLEAAQKGQVPPAKSYFVAPQIIERQSVRALTSALSSLPQLSSY
jgi:DNA-binding LacI/PurR family transcriptional regulator